MQEQAKNTENQDLISAARESVKAEDRWAYVDGIPVFIDGGALCVADDLIGLIEERRENPRRRSGRTTLTELDSFVEHVNRMKEERTVIFADVSSCMFTAIYNYDDVGHESGKAGWCDHRAVYECPLSPEWLEWTKMSGIEMSQDRFSEWIDERIDDIVEYDGCPKPIELSEMARNLQIYTSGTFRKRIDKTTGQYALECKEEHTSESTEIPKKFMTALRIFEGGVQYRAEIHLRFRIRDGKSYFSFAIHRQRELVRDAFGEMRTTVNEATERPVFAGGIL